MVLSGEEGGFLESQVRRHKAVRSVSDDFTLSGLNHPGFTGG